MGNIYDGAFRTILNDCRQLIIPVINEIFGEDYTGGEEIIGAFDKRTIIELSRDVIKEIARKYENVRKGVGEIMVGALVDTEARRILNKGKDQGVNETKKQTALRMLKDGELSIEKIAEYSGLKVAEVEQLADSLTV